MQVQAQPKMKRKEIQIYLLLAFILTTSQCYYSTAMRNIHSAESVGFKLKPAQARESSAAGHMSATWINKSGIQDQKTAHKVPSGPSPIGNRHPPILRRG
ncbi:CLAVATA3/ESR (CLE)-related protein 46-like [Corylus avellana]|uniref:CLAVATA3/ESR (CLE)-related protein 46-like n=1 Tax=Corylus avellana TaxID=13451 RepID=UPI00286B4A81|nr:CLAVATA3/ESR (CLE)-related protein 46-like [Corylus avellana]